ncbi:MAG: MFS transporter [Chloroflexi bacterium]|nr:MFS transporter [Chloroflexota bacterium]
MENQKRNRVLALLFAGVLMGALDIAIVGPALPAIRQQFGVDARRLAWIFSAYVLFNLVGTPLMAKLSDLYGRRWIYVLDVGLFAGGSLLVATAPSFEMVLVGRAVQGFGSSGIFPVASAVIGDTFPPEKRGSALGIIGAVFGLAFLVGPLLGGLLLPLGWQWLFLINLPVAVAVIVFSLGLLPAGPRRSSGRFDVPGMLILAVLLAALALGVNRIDTQNFLGSLASPQVWPFWLAFLFLLPALVFVERRAEQPILNPGLFQSRQLRLTYGLATGAGFSEAGLVFVPLLAVAALGVPEASASFMLVPLVLTVAAGAPLAGKMLDRMGSRVVILSGTAVMTAGVFLLSRFASSLPLFMLSGALVGLGLSALLGAPLRYIMLNEAGAGERSVAQSIINVFTSAGQLVGGALIGAVADSRGGDYAAAFLVIAGVGVLLVALATQLKGRRAEQAPAGTAPGNWTRGDVHGRNV